VRAEAQVGHLRFQSLEPALDALRQRIDELAQSTAEDPRGTRLRRYAPEEQVVARIELSGPQRRLPRVHAGIDVRGDGSTVAYVGRVRRHALGIGPDEDAIAALRRAIADP
jgi:hypothetical protein